MTKIALFTVALALIILNSNFVSCSPKNAGKDESIFSTYAGVVKNNMGNMDSLLGDTARSTVFGSKGHSRSRSMKDGGGHSSGHSGSRGVRRSQSYRDSTQDRSLGGNVQQLDNLLEETKRRENILGYLPSHIMMDSEKQAASECVRNIVGKLDSVKEAATTAQQKTKNALLTNPGAQHTNATKSNLEMISTKLPEAISTLKRTIKEVDRIAANLAGAEGGQIVSMKKQLMQKARVVEDALDEVTGYYQTMARDCDTLCGAGSSYRTSQRGSSHRSSGQHGGASRSRSFHESHSRGDGSTRGEGVVHRNRSLKEGSGHRHQHSSESTLKHSAPSSIRQRNVAKGDKSDIESYVQGMMGKKK